MTINIIVGAPCAGKSTHVVANAKDGSVIIDLDKIANAIGSSAPHQTTDQIRSVAFKMRWAAIDLILGGIDTDAWIIHTNPSSLLIDRYVDAGAEFTLLEPTKAVCLERAEKDERPEGTVEAIERWYASPPVIPKDALIDALSGTVNALQTTIAVGRAGQKSRI